MNKLNIGCGPQPLEGYDNLDCCKFKGVDIVWNLERLPLPIKDETYDEVYARHVIEHISHVDRLLYELYRITKIGGRVIIEVPYETSRLTWGALEHKRAYNLHTLDVYAQNTVAAKKNKELLIQKRFSILTTSLIFPRGLHFDSYLLEPLFNALPKIYEDTGLRYLFPALSVKYVFIR